MSSFLRKLETRTKRAERTSARNLKRLIMSDQQIQDQAAQAPAADANNQQVLSNAITQLLDIIQLLRQLGSVLQLNATLGAENAKLKAQLEALAPKAVEAE